MNRFKRTLRKRLLALAMSALLLFCAMGYSGAALFKDGGALVYAVVTPTDTSTGDMTSRTDPVSAVQSSSDPSTQDAGTNTPSASDTTTGFDGTVVECRGHKYQYVERGFSWNEAEAWCAGQGGYLATISSQYENDFIAGYLAGCGNKSAYIGISGSTGSDFKWSDGEALSFVNWAQRQPAESTSTVYGKLQAGASQWSSGDASERPLGFLIEWGPKAPLPDSDEKSANTTAVIIIPGMGGSALKNPAGTPVWNAEYNDMTSLRLENGSVSRSDFLPDDDNPLYDELIADAQTVCSSSDVCLFQWDWRKDTSSAVDDLDKMIAEKGWTKVSLIGHDIGGLLACEYLKINGDEKIDKLITLGTPFYGSTRAVYTIMTGVFCDGFSSCSGETNSIAATFPSLSSIVPCDRAENVVGHQGVTGALTRLSENAQLPNLLGISSNSKCKSLYTLYDAIKDKFADKFYIVASTGIPTLSGIAVNDDYAKVEKVYATVSGDGNSLISSTAPDFGARAPYIISGIDCADLVSDDTALALIGNILSDLGDTADYNANCTLEVSREKPKSDLRLFTVTASGDCSLTVTNEHGGINFSGSNYSIGGTGHSGYLCADGTKIVFTTDKASLIDLTINGAGSKLEIKNAGKSALRWSKLPSTNAVELTMRISEGRLNVKDSPVSIESPIPHDKWSPVPVKEEEPHKGYRPTGFDLGALGCFVLAAALCFIGIPMCAFGLTKIEILGKREMKRRAALMKKQMRINEKLGVYAQQNPYDPNDPYRSMRR